jgi:Na+-translocating ferredoxin:NAD+ oxidoreductase RnfG subunit
MSSIWASATSSRRVLAGVVAVALAVGLATSGEARVFYSRNQALELAFPDADRVESQTFVLDDEQARRIEELSRSPIDSKLVRVYTGVRDELVVGYAVIDVHNVRTLPEAFMVVLSPEGTVRSLRVLAFHEPLDYLPTGRWYQQFDEKTLAEPLRLGGDVHGVVGATLSARATTRGVRRVLAYYEVLIQGRRQ